MGWLKDLFSDKKTEDSNGKLSILGAEIIYRIPWKMRCEIDDILEKRGYDLIHRKGKRDIVIVGFSNFTELFGFLLKYKILVKPVKKDTPLYDMQNNIITEGIEIIPIDEKETKNFNKNFTDAVVALWETKHIGVQYTP